MTERILRMADFYATLPIAMDDEDKRWALIERWPDMSAQEQQEAYRLYLRRWIDSKMDEVIADPLDAEDDARFWPKIWSMREAYLGERRN